MPTPPGRAAELTTLLRSLDGAAAGRPTVLRVHGPAGIGKTEILSALVDAARERDFVAAGARMSGPGAVEAYRPAGELVSSVLAAQPDPPRGLVDHLREAVTPKRLEILADAIGFFPGMAWPAAAGKLAAVLFGRGASASGFDKYKQDRVGLLSDALLASSADRPTLLVLDDVQWLDAGTTEVLANLLRSTAERKRQPLAVVLAWRPADVDREPLGSIVDRYVRPTGVVTDVSIGGLPTEAVAASAAHLLGRPADIPAPFSRWLSAQSEGNPLRLRALLSVLVEWGIVTPRDGCLRLSEPFGPGGAAPGVLLRASEALARAEGATASELYAIPASLRRVLEAGAVWGSRFAIDAALDTAELRRAEGHEVLRDGLRRGLLREDSTFRIGSTDAAAACFTSEQQRAWLVRQLPGATRRHLHAGAADWWELRARELLAEVVASFGGLEHDGDDRRSLLVVRELLDATERGAGHLAEAGRPLDALELLVSTAEGVVRHSVLVADSEASPGDRGIILILLPFLDRLGARVPDLAQQQRWRPDVLRARRLEGRFALASARAYLDLDHHTLASRCIEQAAGAVSSLDDTDLGLELLLARATLASSTGEIDAVRVVVSEISRMVESDPGRSVAAVLAALPEWPTVASVRALRARLIATLGDDPRLIDLRVGALRESLWFGAGSDAERGSISRFLRSASGAEIRAVLEEIEHAFESVQADDDVPPSPAFLSDAAATVALLDEVAMAGHRVADKELELEASSLAYTCLRFVHGLATPEAIRALSVKARREALATLSTGLLAKTERERRLGQLRASFATSRDPGLRQMLVEDELVPGPEALGLAAPLLVGAPTSERCILAISLFNRRDASSLDIKPVAAWLGDALAREGLEGDSRASAAVGLASYLRSVGRKGEALEWAMRVANHYDRVDAAEADFIREDHGLPGRRLSAEPPPQVELPTEPSAADAQAECAYQAANRADGVEVAERWFERASLLFARVPGGGIRRSGVHQRAAEVWWEHFAELDDDDDEVLSRAVERATWHLAEAIRLLRAAGATVDAEMLEWDLWEREAELVGGVVTAENWNSRLWSSVETMLARGDLDNALLALEQVADYIEEIEVDEEELPRMMAGLGDIARRVGQAGVMRAEPWWGSRSSEVARRFDALGGSSA